MDWARLWRGHPAFSPGNKISGSLFLDQEELAAEIMVRVINRLKVEPTSDTVDQVDLFHRVALYSRESIAQSNYCVPSIAVGSAVDAGDHDSDYSGQKEIAGPPGPVCNDDFEHDQAEDEPIHRT